MSTKSEFSYMSGMSTDRDPNVMSTNGDTKPVVKEEKASCSQPASTSCPTSSSSAHEDSSSPSDPCDSDYDPGGQHEAPPPASPAAASRNNNQQNGHQLRARGANKKTDCTSDSETQGRLRKKPKIESRSNSDCDSDASDFEDGQAVNGLLTNNGFASPFPSPDHNYAISPVKIDVSEIKDETEESVKEEVKEEPQDDETPNSRYKVLVIRLFWA